MNRGEIEELIIETLAADAGKDRGQLRSELEDRGEHMPVDSVLAAEVLTRVEAAVGVSLPTTAEASRCLRSVRTFAQAIYDLVAARDGGEVETA